MVERGEAMMHPCVLGELACGTLRERVRTLRELQQVPAAHAATDGEVRALIESARLWGRGLSWIDAHLLAAARLARTQLWTRDVRLREAATELGVAAAMVPQ